MPRPTNSVCFRHSIYTAFHPFYLDTQKRYVAESTGKVHGVREWINGRLLFTSYVRVRFCTSLNDVINFNLSAHSKTQLLSVLREKWSCWC